MPEHSSPGKPRTTDTEPATVSELARLVVAVLAGAGVLTFPQPVLDWITVGLGGALSIALSWWTRGKVRPVVKSIPAPPRAPPKMTHSSGRPEPPRTPIRAVHSV